MLSSPNSESPLDLCGNQKCPPAPLEVIASSALDAAGFVVVAIRVRIAGAILLVQIARGREYPFDLATGGLISW